MAARSSAPLAAGTCSVAAGARRVRADVPRAVVVEREDMLRAGREGDFRHPAEVAWRAHHHGRLGVADEVFDLAALVGRVERQEDIARAQRRQVQHHGFDRFLDLHGDAAAFGQLQRRQQVGDARAGMVEVAPAVEQGLAIGAGFRRRSGPGRTGKRRAGPRTGWRWEVMGFKRQVDVWPGRRRCLRGARHCRRSRRRSVAANDYASIAACAVPASV